MLEVLRDHENRLDDYRDRFRDLDLWLRDLYRRIGLPYPGDEPQPERSR